MLLCVQEAQLPQKNSASATHIFLLAIARSLNQSLNTAAVMQLYM